MTNSSGTVAKSALTLLVVGGVLSAATLTKDLSGYRGFQLGSNLATIVKQVGTGRSEMKIIHRRPALIQELTWRPQALGSSAPRESVEEVVFSFYDGELFQIAVTYDRYETEGMTTDDFIEAISGTYGTAESLKSPAGAKGEYGDQEEIVARWQDSQYAFDLIRASYGPTFKMVGVLKRLEAPAHAAIHEAKRLDEQEAPQRDAALKEYEAQVEQAKREKARLVNKPRFRQ